MSEAGNKHQKTPNCSPHASPKSGTSATAQVGGSNDAKSGPEPEVGQRGRGADRAVDRDGKSEQQHSGDEHAHTDSAADTDAVEQLSAKLAERDARLEATLGQYKEALDEFARVKARLTRDVAKEVQAGKRSFITQLLDVLDNLERALEAALADPKQAQTSLCEGVTLVRDQFHARLAGLGVKKLPALGQPFDPLHFEAVSTVPTSDPSQDGHVIGVMRDAYLLDDETLRHGIVAVGKHGGTT